MSNYYNDLNQIYNTLICATSSFNDVNLHSSAAIHTIISN